MLLAGLDISPEMHWAVGLFEGEGSIILRESCGKKNGKGVKLSFQSTDEDVVKRFTDIVKVGSMLGPYKIKSGKNIWMWQCCKAKDVSQLLVTWTPLLSNRRREAAAIAYGKVMESIERIKCS